MLEMADCLRHNTFFGADAQREQLLYWFGEIFGIGTTLLVG
jgi:hypothetical protein